ncbi:hypothetical protein [Paraburkholderia sp. BCC1885]|uniref:hypothetical protein n=1 Tax=Paraburkholderia sp. BCC1885 TaxID=2562669 RepID=UPI001183F39A|nr:hypothetical protein [Paraburkholderia sp. BCC1885]
MLTITGLILLAAGIFAWFAGVEHGRDLERVERETRPIKKGRRKYRDADPATFGVEAAFPRDVHDGSTQD